MKNTPHTAHRTIALILLFSLLFTRSYSQGNSNRDYWTKITERELNMEVRHQKKLDKLKGNNLFKSIDPIKLGNIRSFIQQGKLQFKNPKNTEILVAVPTYVTATSDNEFSWNGKFEDGRGHITLIAHGGDIFGRFDIDDEVYEIQDLGGKRNALLKFDKNKEFICGDHQVTQNYLEPQRPSDLIQNRVSPLSCDNNVRILVLYTPLVEQFQNPYNIATIGVNDLNISTRNSGISTSDLSFTLAGVALLPGFSENPNIDSTFQQFKNAPDVNVLRQNYQADLVVLLTGLTYEGAEGGVASAGTYVQNGVYTLNPDESWRCIVNANWSSSFYAFAHEVAHLFTCKHNDFPDNSFLPAPLPNDWRGKQFTTTTTSCNRCWLFFTCCTTTSHNRQTIMAGRSSSITTIPHFSNPDISYEGVSTGELGFRNNARLLKSLACQVANFVASEPPMPIEISGPNNCSSYEYYNWCASVNNCTNVTNINWEVSINGIDYSPFGYGSCIGSSLPSGTSFCYLRVTATCTNGNSATTYFPININQGGYLRANQNGDSLNINTIKMNQAQVINDNDIIISPNPSSDKVQVSIKTEQSDLLFYKRCQP